MGELAFTKTPVSRFKRHQCRSIPPNSFTLPVQRTQAWGVERHASITVKSPRLISIVIPRVLRSNRATQGGFAVILRSQGPGGYLTYPGTVKVEGGKNAAEFKGKVGDVPSERSGQIVAEGGSSVIPANTTLKP
jgi:hypothetical protein